MGAIEQAARSVTHTNGHYTTTLRGKYLIADEYYTLALLGENKPSFSKI